MNDTSSTSNMSLPTITPISAFEDNYIWLIRHQQHAIVVDPGDAQPVIEILREQQLTLTHILVTHHHADHIGGVDALLARWPMVQVYAPAKERYSFAHIAVSEGDDIHLSPYGLQLKVMEIPGHTLGHIAYYGQSLLFCGDTLFGAGCGRLFEGTAEQLYHSLQRLASLPSDTQVFCTHEYTQRNIDFALQFEPNNQALIARAAQTAQIRKKNLASLPSTIALELATNPFLRGFNQEIKLNLGFGLAELENTNSLQVFTRLRQLRNTF